MNVDQEGFVRGSHGQRFDHLSLKSGVNFPLASDMWKDNWIIDRDTKDSAPMRDVFDGSEAECVRTAIASRRQWKS